MDTFRFYFGHEVALLIIEACCTTIFIRRQINKNSEAGHLIWGNVKAIISVDWENLISHENGFARLRFAFDSKSDEFTWRYIAIESKHIVNAYPSISFIAQDNLFRYESSQKDCYEVCFFF